MVNETNKPQEILEHEELSQRLASSNQALANMQLEHRQLLQEMEQLRKRAEDLQRFREQQDLEQEQKRLEYQRVQEELAKATDEGLQRNEENENVNENENTKVEAENNAEEDNSEDADYIKEKLAEIARLKAQFKRVQHMINTTELIESHINKSESTEKQLPEVKLPLKADTENAKCETSSTAPAAISGIVTSNPEPLVMPNMPTMADVNAATTSDEKEQLILTMVNMFQDFSSDLKSQADNLRLERERIKELKESIIRSRKGQPK